jgi:hypothetical protein
MNRHRMAAPIIATVLILLPMYLGSYLVLVVPTGNIVADRTSPYTYESFENGRLIETTVRLDPYRAGNGFCKWFYWPLEKIDRRVRPEEWDPRISTSW